MKLMPILMRVEVDGQKVTKRLGYKSSPPLRLNRAVKEALDRAKGLISPQGIYVEKQITSFSGKDILIEGGTSFRTAKIGHYLVKCCDRLAVFLVTIGGELENEISRLTERGEVLSAMILDVIGSEAVERAADFFENFIRSSQEKGRGATLRFSPGYCDWEVSDQGSIFKLVDSSKLGIELNESYVMTPIKSISGIIGLGRIKKIAEEPTPCQVCPQKDCHYRRDDFQVKKSFSGKETKGIIN